MPKIDEFPNCCTANILYDLGGTDLSGLDRQATEEKELRAWLKDVIAEYREQRLLIIITNDAQDIANDILRELNFRSSRWMKKRAHPNSQIRLWWKEPYDE